MTPYHVLITRANYPGEYATILYGEDRTEVLAFTKKTYRKVLVEVLSVRKVKTTIESAED
jgi:hypothetical protein